MRLQINNTCFKKCSDVEELSEIDTEETIDDDPDQEAKRFSSMEMKLNDASVMKKRAEKKIIRYARYNKEKDPDNLYRVGWLVVLGLTALSDSISIYIGPSPKEREKEEKQDR